MSPRHVAAISFVALVACKEKVPTVVADAAPAPAAVDADANLPWATEINMDASTAAASASSPAPAAAPTAAAFAGPTGIYTGNVKDSGDVYTITVNLTPAGGTVAYSAPLNCKGRWTLKGAPSSAGTSFNYVEKITEQPSPPKCADNVPVVLTRDPSQPGVYAYSAGGGQARALLKKL